MIDEKTESRGLRGAGIAVLASLAVLLLLSLPPGAPLRNPETGSLIEDAPLMNSLIVSITLIFLLAGIGYGIGAKTLTTSTEVINGIIKTWASLAGLLFMLFLISQFIAYFNYSDMPTVVSVAMADLLEQANVGPVWLLIGFILVIALLDIIIPGLLPKWAIFAPVFIPLFIRLDVAPQTLLAAYRLADSPMNVITPLMVYIPFIVLVAQRYKKDAGLGTVISLMIPYTFVVLITWRSSSSSGSSSASRWAPATRRTFDADRTSRPRRPTRVRQVPVMNDAAITLVVLAVVVVLFVWNRLPVEVIAIGSALALFVLGVLDFTEAIAGFGDSTVVMIAALFVVSEGLDSTGVTAWIGQRLITLAGDSKRRLLVFTMLLAAGLTAMINLNGAVAALLPMAVDGRGPPAAETVPAPDADGVRGQCRVAAAAHRQPGERDLRRQRGGGRRGPLRVRRVRPGRDPRWWPGRMVAADAGRGPPAPRPRRRAVPRSQPARRHPGPALRPRAASPTCACVRSPRLMGRPAAAGNLSSYPGLNVITVLDGESGPAGLRRRARRR